MTYTVNIVQSTEKGCVSELGMPGEFVDSLINKFDKVSNVYVLKRN